MNFKIPDDMMAWFGPVVIVNIFIWIIALDPRANRVVCPQDGSCLVTWIGALSGWVAAAAAFFTIRAMISTDVQAEKRHRELVDLTLRADRLRLERALLPGFQDLRDNFKILRDCLSELASKRGVELDDHFSSQILNLRGALLGCLRVTNSSDFVGAADLYGGLLTRRLERLQLKLVVAMKVAERADATTRRMSIFDQNGKAERATSSEAMEAITAAKAAMEHVFQQIYPLADQYSIKLDELPLGPPS